MAAITSWATIMLLVRFIDIHDIHNLNTPADEADDFNNTEEPEDDFNPEEYEELRDLHDETYYDPSLQKMFDAIWRKFSYDGEHMDKESLIDLLYKTSGTELGEEIWEYMLERIREGGEDPSPGLRKDNFRGLYASSAMV